MLIDLFFNIWLGCILWSSYLDASVTIQVGMLKLNKSMLTDLFFNIWLGCILWSSYLDAFVTIQVGMLKLLWWGGAILEGMKTI